jgi:outer membrane biosynthesis protein TonB
MAEGRKPEEMTDEVIAQANGEPLPDRQAMSVIRGVQPEPVFPIDPGHGGYTIDPPPPEEA